MKLTIRTGRRCSPLLLAGLLTAGLSAAGAQEVVALRTVAVSKSVGSDVRAAGTQKSDIKLDRMLLLLAPRAAQQKALDSMLAAQITPGNAGFHKWLTPGEFASRFAVSASDAAAVASWLRAQGFVVAALPASRGWIEFSGTAAQVERAFGSGVAAASDAHANAGQIRFQLSGQAKVPASIAPHVKGLVSLDGVVSATAATSPVVQIGGIEAMAAAKTIAGAPALTPALATEWLRLSSLQTEGATGAGESIAIPSRSNVRVEDFAAFRKSFGLPDAALDVQLASADLSPTGAGRTDPGRTGDEAAAMQAVSWAGVAAPEAHIVLVPAASTNATDGLDLALAAIVDGALAHTVSVGYTACEGNLSAAHLAFYAALYRQAAAQGMAIVAASGDSGAAACHGPKDPAPVSSGLEVNALASTPWNTAVGAVAFNADATALTAWQPAKVEDPAFATGGGFSQFYSTPEWQSAIGIPLSDPGTDKTLSGHHRYLPDVSLPTAANGVGSRGLAFCLAGETAVSGCRLVSAGGSGASAAIFSGIAALLAQKYGPQGNLAANLYALRRSDSGSSSKAAFVDVVAGSAKLPCKAGSPQCSDAGEIGFSAGLGYDLASGLGSINADALLKKWANPQDTGTAAVTVEMTTLTSVTYNPSATITLSAKVLSGSGSTVPTGTVQFYDETTKANAGTAVTLAADGTASYSETGQFTAGGHNIQAQYSGDGTYEAAVSQPVTIEVQPSPTALAVIPSTTTPTGGSVITATGTVTATNPGATPPSGTLTVNLDGVAQGNALLATSGGVTSASVSVTVPTAGSHTIQGTYSGDINYNNSTSPSVTIVVAKSATVTTLSATPSTLTTGVPESFTAVIAPASTSICTLVDCSGDSATYT